MRRWGIALSALLVVGVLYSALWRSPRSAGVVEAEADVAPPASDGQAAPVNAAAGPNAPGQHAAADPRAQAADGPPVPGTSLRNPTSVLMASFEQEPRDALWADRKEAEIHEVLSDEALPEDLIQSAGCRTTVCRIEMQWKPNSNEGYARLSQLIGQHWAPQIGIEYPPDARERRALTVYIIREGYSLDDVSR